MESNVNIGVFGHIPTTNVNDDVLFRDDPDAIDAFDLPSLTMNLIVMMMMLQ